MNKTSKIILQIGILLAFIGTIVVNVLSSIGLINNVAPEALSDALPNLFVPAGLTFTVWGVIYLGLLALTIYSIRSWFIKEMDPPEVVEKMGIEFVVAAVGNISWIFLFHYQVELGSSLYSLIAMLILLAALITAYIRLRVGKNEEATASEKWFVHIPFSFYMGWITIATVANVSALLTEYELDGLYTIPDNWKIILTIIVISVAVIITLLALFLRKDIAYSLVVIWALVGIIIKRYEVAPPVVLEVVITAGVGIGLIVVMIGVTIFRLVKQRREAQIVA